MIAERWIRRRPRAMWQRSDGESQEQQSARKERATARLASIRRPSLAQRRQAGTRIPHRAGERIAHHREEDVGEPPLDAADDQRLDVCDGDHVIRQTIATSAVPSPLVSAGPGEQDAGDAMGAGVVMWDSGPCC